MISIKQNIIQSGKVIILGLLLGVGVSYLHAATTWTGATCPPPNCNKDTPINVSLTSQTKQGPLTINGIFQVINNAFLQRLQTTKWFNINNGSSGPATGLSGGDIRSAVVFGSTDSFESWYLGEVASAPRASDTLGLYNWNNNRWVQTWNYGSLGGSDVDGQLNATGDICAFHGGTEKCLSSAAGAKTIHSYLSKVYRVKAINSNRTLSDYTDYPGDVLLTAPDSDAPKRKSIPDENPNTLMDYCALAWVGEAGHNARCKIETVGGNPRKWQLNMWNSNNADGSGGDNTLTCQAVCFNLE